MHKKSLIVSIHDVRPGLLPEIQQMMSTLAQIGISRTSLLVIPNFHRHEPITANQALIYELRRLQDQGHEIVLHALYHLEDAQPDRGGVREFLLARLHTRGEGEFLRLHREEARKRIASGLECLRRLGFSPTGFVAPAWLYSKDSVAAISDNGLEYYTTLYHICTTDPPSRIPSRAIVWWNRKYLRCLSNLFLPRMSQRIMSQQQPLRLALHPPDFQHATVRRTALAIIARALAAGYQPTTYADYVREPYRDKALAF